MTCETSQQGTEAHCDEGSGRPAHTDETVPTPELQVNKVHGRVALCVPISQLRIPVE